MRLGKACGCAARFRIPGTAVGRRSRVRCGPGWALWPAWLQAHVPHGHSEAMTWLNGDDRGKQGLRVVQKGVNACTKKGLVGVCVASARQNALKGSSCRERDSTAAFVSKGLWRGSDSTAGCPCAEVRHSERGGGSRAVAPVCGEKGSGVRAREKPWCSRFAARPRRARRAPASRAGAANTTARVKAMAVAMGPCSRTKGRGGLGAG